MKEQLTERQQQILTTIIEFSIDHGYPPTLRELGRILGIKSTNGVSDHLKLMEKKGVIERGHGARALKVKNEAA